LVIDDSLETAAFTVKTHTKTDRQALLETIAPSSATVGRMGQLVGRRVPATSQHLGWVVWRRLYHKKRDRPEFTSSPL
jgi:hypothetical protein